VNLGRLVLNEPAPIACTPYGIVELLRRFGVVIDGADVAVIGRGITVGRPLGLLLTRRTENATVTLCHTGTRDLAGHVRRADIVVAAAGVPTSSPADMVRPGAAVLDVGVSRVDGKIAGDVALDVREVAGYVAPNPGGVGPMTSGHAVDQRRRGRRAEPRAGPEHVAAGRPPDPGPGTVPGRAGRVARVRRLSAGRARALAPRHRHPQCLVAAGGGAAVGSRPSPRGSVGLSHRVFDAFVTWCWVWRSSSSTSDCRTDFGGD